VKKSPVCRLGSAGGVLLLLPLLAGCAALNTQPEQKPIFTDPAAANMAVLQAKSIEGILSENFRVTAVNEFQNFEDEIVLRLEMHNPLGQTVELIPNQQGYLFEFTTRMRRWRWDGAGESESNLAQTYFATPIRLASGDTQGEEWTIDVDLGGEETAIWELELGLTVHLAGIKFGNRRLPLRKLNFVSVRVLAFPPGWQALSENPITSLEKVVVMPQSAADRHVLVIAAVAAKTDRRKSLQILIEAMNEVPNRERLRSLKAALEFLTGERHPNRLAWRKWWDSQKNIHP